MFGVWVWLEDYYNSSKWLRLLWIVDECIDSIRFQLENVLSIRIETWKYQIIKEPFRRMFFLTNLWIFVEVLEKFNPLFKIHLAPSLFAGQTFHSANALMRKHSKYVYLCKDLWLRNGMIKMWADEINGIMFLFRRITANGISFRHISKIGWILII